MNRLRAFWRYCLLLIFRRAPEPSPPPPVQSEPAADSAALSESVVADAAPEQRPQPSEPIEATAELAADAAPLVSGNRHLRRREAALRRKLERARMQHDEWVKPGGPEPIKHERSAPASKAPLPAPPPFPETDFVDPNDRIIADEWIEGDGGGEVLFEQSEFWGTFNFRDTILKQLERYWVYIERMKKNDPDAYGFYKQLGATLLPYVMTGTRNKHDYMKKLRGKDLDEFKSEIYLTAWFKEHWPAFGCICYGINPVDEERERTDLKGNLWTPKFIYFVRLRTKPWPWYIQPMSGGKLYLMTMWWDRPDHPKSKNYKWGVPNTFPIWISEDGNTIRALKTRESSNGYRSEYDWRIPHAYSSWAKQYGLTAQIHLTHCFATATEEIERSYYSMCRVAVTKGDATAVFGIEPQRLPYFFKDRDVTLDAHGRKQRILHSVRPHVRDDGRAVTMQFRGLSEFDWAGYHVSITVPGRDHLLLQEFDVPLFVPKRRARRTKDWVREADVASYLKEKIKSGFGALR